MWNRIVYVEDNVNLQLLAEDYGIQNIFHHVDLAIEYINDKMPNDGDRIVYCDFNGIGDVEKLFTACKQSGIQFCFVSDDKESLKMAKELNCSYLFKKQFLDFFKTSKYEESSRRNRLSKPELFAHWKAGRV